ncbi:hypothetical protein GGU11DRAFT_877012 [Lentinula aff. detonsa]|nr:hypothetical protein GGU11DRAFT_877012 [Lentinula aff. detonsa]
MFRDQSEYLKARSTHCSLRTMSIHSLPVEILREIFCLHLHDVKKRPAFPDPYGKSESLTHVHAAANAFPLPHVCTFWRSICNASPNLYPTLTLHYRHGDEDIIPTPPLSESRLGTFLRLTAPHPISIAFNITSSDSYGGNYLRSWYGSEERVLSFGSASGLVQLLEHCHRWKSATISIPYPFISIFFLKDIVYPCLKKLDLHVSSSSADRDNEKLDVFSGKFFQPACTPNLHIITLQQGFTRDIVLPWGGGSTVRVIILHDIYLKLEDMGAIKECTNLHTIHFSSCAALSPDDPTLPTEHILLHNVNNVSCSWIIPRGDVQCTPLSFLILPKLHRLQIQWTEGLEQELVELFERSSFQLKELTLIQVPRGIFRPPTEQFISLIACLSNVESINQSLLGLELNHTDSKWDAHEFQKLMEVLTLKRGSTSISGARSEDSLYFGQENTFPFLKNIAISGYLIPDNAAFLAMLQSRYQSSSTENGLEILRLQCPKSTFSSQTTDYLGNLAAKGMKVFYVPWVGVSRKKWTIWNHPSYEVD